MGRWRGRALGLKLAQASLGLFEGLRGLIALGFEAGELFALVALVVAALLGFVLSTDFGCV